MQCTVFAVHTHNDILVRSVPACAGTAAFAGAAPAPDKCRTGKTDVADTCAICQTLQHAGGKLDAAPSVSVAFAFTLVERARAIDSPRAGAPAQYRHRVRAPPILV